MRVASSRRKSKWVEKPHGKYLWEDLRDPPKAQVKGYRTIRQGDHVVRVALLRSGKTVATSIGHPKSERKRGKRKKR